MPAVLELHKQREKASAFSLPITLNTKHLRVIIQYRVGRFIVWVDMMNYAICTEVLL